MKPQFLFNLVFCIAFVGLLGFTGGCGSDDNVQAPPLVEETDEVPPLMPVGLDSPKKGPEGVLVTWAPNAEADLAGYRVYLYAPSPQQENDYKQLNDQVLTKSRYIFRAPGDEPQVHILRISAVDRNGNESVLSPPIEVSPYIAVGPPIDRDASGDSNPGRHPSPTPAPPGGGHPEDGDQHGHPGV